MSQVICGDCLEVLKTLPDNSVDACVTDPPYELGFMGKTWDNSGIANNPDTWREVLRVLKPGGHLLSFSSTRTYHRQAVAIEDAGFEIRDMVEWVYGSGFPKSLNIGKAVDKIQGNEREVVGRNPNSRENCDKTNTLYESGTVGKTDIMSKGTSPYEGWGTALKPAHETCCLAHKPLDSSSDEDYTRYICQTLYAQIVEKSSTLSLDEKTQLGIAQWSAEKNINTLDDLLEVMAMLPLKLVGTSNLNTALLWLNILADVWIALNTYIIKTELNLTTELRILKSMEWANILANITQVNDKTTDGLSADVYSVESLLNVVKLKLKDTLIRSADANAIFSENLKDLRPNKTPICLARKPIEGTVANNVLKYGTGGINIDKSRVGTEDNLNGGGYNTNGTSTKNLSDATSYATPVMDKEFIQPTGRFPANLLHDGLDEVVSEFPNSDGCKPHLINASDATAQSNKEKGWGSVSVPKNKFAGFNDNSKSASRFFKSFLYCPKASKSERDRGCDELELKIRAEKDGRDNTINSKYTLDGKPQSITPPSRNNHPTVKPLALMKYLIQMITPEGGVVLDPFAGSGSTLVAAKELGYDYIGIEMTEEYIPIIEARLAGAVKEVTQERLL